MEQLSNITKTENYFENRNVKGYGFSTEKEAEFSEHLFNYLSNLKPDKIMSILMLINSLAGIKSDWKFIQE